MELLPVARVVVAKGCHWPSVDLALGFVLGEAIGMLQTPRQLGDVDG
jgi:hypothetical protein